MTGDELHIRPQFSLHLRYDLFLDSGHIGDPGSRGKAVLVLIDPLQKGLRIQSEHNAVRLADQRFVKTDRAFVNPALL